MAYLAGDVNAHRDQDIRRALHVLSGLAERPGCCVIVLRHLNKSGGGNALYRGGGSIGIIGAARAGFMCGRDPDDETGARRVFANIKMNIAPEPPSLAYWLVPRRAARRGPRRLARRRASTVPGPARRAGQRGRPQRAGRGRRVADRLPDRTTAARRRRRTSRRPPRADGIAERTLDRARAGGSDDRALTASAKAPSYVWRLDPSCTPHARHERQALGSWRTWRTWWRAWRSVAGGARGRAAP